MRRTKSAHSVYSLPGKLKARPGTQSSGANMRLSMEGCGKVRRLKTEVADRIPTSRGWQQNSTVGPGRSDSARHVVLLSRVRGGYGAREQASNAGERCLRELDWEYRRKKPHRPSYRASGSVALYVPTMIVSLHGLCL